MSKAKIYCEVICGKCGALACNSKYYKNAFTISSLKENTKDWIWDDKLAMCDFIINYEKYETKEDYEAKAGGYDGEVYELRYLKGNGNYIVITG